MHHDQYSSADRRENHNNGADFICVGMYDFQVVNNVNIAIDYLKKTKRTRGWYG